MIRKLFLPIALLFSTCLLNAQIFNTAEVLKPAKFSLGVAPAYFNENFGLFLTGGAGIKSGVDFSLKYVILDTRDYFGADLEWRLIRNSGMALSLTTGCHNYYDFGLDVAGNISFQIMSDISFYTGLDMDINFGNNLYAPFWIPVGVEIKLNRIIAFIFEAEIPINDSAFPIIDGGFLFRF